MPFNLSFHAVLAFGFFFALASAHMKMSSPVPFDVDVLDNSPLKPDGSDYPCKTCGYKISEMNTIAAGSDSTLQLSGSAIHGGGSCQIAISMDKTPTRDSKFKVITTYEGDCPPAAGTALTFKIPKEFPTVDRATLAWTWFNRIGNREMYMNLAPIKITGGSDNQDYYKSLTDLFVANIPATDCTTPEMSDPTIPNPGDFVVRASTYKPGAVTGPKCGAAAPDSSSGSGSGSGSGGAASSAPGGNDNNGMYSQPAASPAQPTSSAASSAAPSATLPASSAAPPSTFSTHTVPASSAAPPTYPTLSPTFGHGISGPSTGSAAPTGSPASSSGSAGSPGQCTTDGAIVCNGSTQFGLCDHGSVAWQAVAAGTTCSNGAILKRSQPVLPPLPRRHARGFHKVRAL